MRPRRKKTRKMLEAEARLGRRLEDALPEMLTEMGLSATADRLGVSKATLGYWLLKLGIEGRRYYLRPQRPNKVDILDEKDRLRSALEGMVRGVLTGEVDAQVLQEAIGALQDSDGEGRPWT